MVVIGSARIDERGKASGGAAGDQKQVSAEDYKGEVSMQTMYQHSKGWYVLRPNSDIVANALSHAMIRACNNPNLGYDQNQRLGVITYGIDSKIKTECDCSSLVRACCIAVGFDPGNFTTANEKNVLAKTGIFGDIISYISQAKTPLYDGDVLVTKTKGHTAIVVSGNPRGMTAKKNPYPIPARTLKRKTPMMVGEDVKWVQWALNMPEVDGKFGPDTEKSVKAFQKAHDLIVDGIVGKDTRAKLNM